MPYTPIDPRHDDAAAQALTRAWVDWMEAGRLWMSWWVSALPNPPWPPAGMLIPPVDEPTKAVMPPAGTQTPPRVSVAGRPAATSRAAGSRHH